MKDWQGPAIWIYNDVMFNENDFNALLNIHEGGKRADPTKIVNLELDLIHVFILLMSLVLLVANIFNF